jgi:hypothetical protein
MFLGLWVFRLTDVLGFGVGFGFGGGVIEKMRRNHA